MRIQTRRPGSGSDGGFTLVELIIAIAIIGIITVPLGDVIIGYLRNTDATTARLLASHDVQIASAYWAQDVASIGTRSTADLYPLKQSVWTGASYPYPCSTAETPIVRLAWDDFSSAGTPTLVQVVYMEETVSGPTGPPQKELHRVRCEQSSPPSRVVTVGPDLTLAHELSTDPTVSCSTDCEAAPAPKTVTLNLSLKDPGNSFKDPVTNAGVYVVKLTGQRRQSP